MATRAEATAWATGAALAVLFAGSQVPVWINWHVDLDHTSAYGRTLWRVLDNLSSNRRDVESSAEMWALHRGNVLTAILLLTVAVAAGWCLYRHMRTESLAWGRGLLIGITAAGILALICSKDLRTEHLFPVVILVGGFAILLLSPEIDNSTATGAKVLDNLIDKKRQGRLLPPVRVPRFQRTYRLAVPHSGRNTTAVTGELDRLVALKRQLRSLESETGDPLGRR